MFDNKVVIFDHTNINPFNISLSHHPRDLTLKLSHNAYFVLYDVIDKGGRKVCWFQFWWKGMLINGERGRKRIKN